MQQTARGRYIALTVVVTLVAVAGYVGYLLFPRFDVPATQGAGLLALAAFTDFFADVFPV